MFVRHSLVHVADRAQELQTTALIRHDQAAQHTSTAARERGTRCVSSLLSFIFFMRQLTVVGIVNASAAGRQQSASLHRAEQQQRVSAHCMLHAMRAAYVHVAVWC